MERFGCSDNLECPLRDTLTGCFEDVHHKAWPARLYRGGLAKRYRELEENKEITCRARHNEIHATEEPPERPSRQEMVKAVAAQAIGGARETAA